MHLHNFRVPVLRGVQYIRSMSLRLRLGIQRSGHARQAGQFRSFQTPSVRFASVKGRLNSAPTHAALPQLPGQPLKSLR